MTETKEQRQILIVDDDIALQVFLEEYLTQHGYLVTLIADGESIENLLKIHTFDLILLDVVLPDKDGWYWLEWLKTNAQNTKVLMLSVKGDVDHRIQGLESGANDYLAKPFNPRELLARINNILPKSHASERFISFGSYRFDLKTLQLTHDETPVALTTSETSLLKYLCANRFMTVTRDQLSQALRGAELSPMDRSVDVHIFNLRHKLEDNPSAPKYICTVWGKGYRFHST